jgi:hypothetical protein
MKVAFMMYVLCQCLSADFVLLLGCWDGFLLLCVWLLREKTLFRPNFQANLKGLFFGNEALLCCAPVCSAVQP